MGKKKSPPKVSVHERFDVYSQDIHRTADSFRGLSDKMGQLVAEDISLDDARLRASEVVESGRKPSIVPVRYRDARVSEQEALGLAKKYLAELQLSTQVSFPYVVRHPLVEEPIWWMFAAARMDQEGERLEPDLAVAIDTLDGSSWSERDMAVWLGLQPRPRYRLPGR